MSLSRNALIPVYPYFRFSVDRDLWFTRISGCGLGNCFYTYFHAVVLAEKFNGAVISPPWLAIKLGPLLRGESSKRTYWGMFRPHTRDIHGLRKLWTMTRNYRSRAVIKIDGTNDPALIKGRLNFVSARKWTFRGLYPYRQLIRDRLLSIINDPIPPNHSWGRGNFIAIHVRLTDFTVPRDSTNFSEAGGSKPTNPRIPMSWYVNVIRALRRRYSDMPVYVFSDGTPEELEPLLRLGASLYRSGSDITDLLQMAAASIFVGSHSSFSRWSAFLGNMHSIWLAEKPVDPMFADEKISDPQVPVEYMPLEGTELIA